MEEVSRQMREAEYTWGRWTQLHDVPAGTYWVCCEAWYRRPEEEGAAPTLADRPADLCSCGYSQEQCDYKDGGERWCRRRP